MDFEMNRSPHEMSLDMLQKRCWNEIEKFRRKELNDDRYCLEIFHRALVLREEQAWNILAQRFHSTIISWVRHHSQWKSAHLLHSEENYVALTIERVWMATVNNRSLEFQTLGAALKFMQLCLNSVIIDTLRSHAKEQTLSKDGIEEPVAPNEESGSEFRDLIKRILPDAREQRLMYLLFYCGLRPRQIIKYCPGEFANVEEIFRITHNMMDRLRRNRELLRILFDIEDL